MAQKTARLIALVLILIVLIGAGVWWFLAPTKPGPLRLTPISFAGIAGWRDRDPSAALAAFRRSCDVLKKKNPGASMGGAGYAGHVSDWLSACAAAPANAMSANEARSFFERWFQPAQVSMGNTKKGLFTGYYEPELHAARTQYGRYQTPIYGVPTDLVDVDLGLFRPEWKGEKIAGYVKGNSLVPYATRAQIDENGIPAAPVLFYADDPVGVFFLHIQGSGRVVLDNGTIVRAAYAAQNGQPYTAIGRTLIAQGALTKQSVSMQSIRAWLKQNPKNARKLMETDRSFVFFREEPIGDSGLGSAGSEGVPLTPGASMAVDLRLHPLGVPFFVTAPEFNRLLIAQDTGGAIRGPVRADVFWGFGQSAEDIAGHMKSQGMLYVLLPKNLAAKLAPHKDFAP